MMPPLPDGFIPPPLPIPNLANHQAFNPAAPFTPPFHFPASQQISQNSLPSSQAKIGIHAHSPAKTVVAETDKEDGEVSDTSLPTGPAPMQGRNWKNFQQPSRERYQPTTRNLKQTKRDERRGANNHKAGRGG